jgi:rhodanese-related sulfurtransferase
MAKAQIQTQEVTRVTVDEVQERLRRGESLAFVDVRNPQAWAAAQTKLPEAIRLSVDEVEQRLHEVLHDRTVITYCT